MMSQKTKQEHTKNVKNKFQQKRPMMSQKIMQKERPMMAQKTKFKHTKNMHLKEQGMTPMMPQKMMQEMRLKLFQEQKLQNTKNVQKNLLTKRQDTQGQQIWILLLKKDDKENIEADKIIPPARSPNDFEKRKIIGKMVQLMALVVMENNVYILLFNRMGQEVY